MDKRRKKSGKTKKKEVTDDKTKSKEKEETPKAGKNQRKTKMDGENNDENKKKETEKEGTKDTERKEKINGFVVREIRNNSMIKYEDLTKKQMIAIYYIMRTRYYENIPDDTNTNISWKGNIDYKGNRKITEDFEAESKIKIVNKNKEDEKMLIITLNIEEGFFSVKGKIWAKWEELGRTGNFRRNDYHICERKRFQRNAKDR